RVIASKSPNLKPIDLETEVYPGFPTDLQQPMTSLLITADGTSHITENIYENRFQNAEYLNQMGADIEINGDTIAINGPKQLKGTVVTTSDLRAGAALILAALVAEGETTIKEVKYVLRGYGNIVKKLTNVGAEISLEEA
ncbi:MAG: UDP-N-acetylglucosamine 1-carboxyvinyltransferase, partial [Floccifex sp.]